MDPMGTLCRGRWQGQWDSGHETLWQSPHILS